MHRSHVRSGKDSSRHLRNCRDYVGIGCTAAEITAHAFADLVVAERDLLGGQISGHYTRPPVLNLAQHADRRADLPGRTVAALERVVFDKRSLQRMHVLAIRQSLDGDDLAVLMRDGEREATIDSPAIEQDCAGTTLPMVTALLGTGEA